VEARAAAAKANADEGCLAGHVTPPCAELGTTAVGTASGFGLISSTQRRTDADGSLQLQR